MEILWVKGSTNYNCILTEFEVICASECRSREFKVAYYSFSETPYRALQLPATRQYYSRKQKWRK